MNKYLFTCILITLLAIKSTAQKIHFTDTTNVWRVLVSVTHDSYTDYGQRSYTYKGSIKKTALPISYYHFPAETQR